MLALTATCPGPVAVSPAGALSPTGLSDAGTYWPQVSQTLSCPPRLPKPLWETLTGALWSSFGLCGHPGHSAQALPRAPRTWRRTCLRGSSTWGNDCRSGSPSPPGGPGHPGFLGAQLGGALVGLDRVSRHSCSRSSAAHTRDGRSASAELGGAAPGLAPRASGDRQAPRFCFPQHARGNGPPGTPGLDGGCLDSPTLAILLETAGESGCGPGRGLWEGPGGLPCPPRCHRSWLCDPR